MQENWGFKTKVVHAGNPETGQWGATAVPIYQTAAFDYTTAANAFLIGSTAPILIVL